ncbi:MAG: hypothetical protein ACI8PT_004268 [Gammaproteobacteria bacterium]|jgi:hypothetical protein
MSKPVPQQIVTANSLLDGHTMYLDRQRNWVLSLDAACIASTPGFAATLLAQAERDAATVVGPRLIDVDVDSTGAAHPRDFREQARAAGPSVGPVRFFA